MKKKTSGAQAEALIAKQPGLRVAHNVQQLPQAMRQEVRELLIEGASLEGTTQAVNERQLWEVTSEAEAQPANEPAGARGDAPGPVTPGGETPPAQEPRSWAVTLNAVAHYLRSNQELQIARTNYLVETAEAITKALTPEGTAESAETRVLNAVVMIGLQRLNEKDFSFAINNVMRRRAEVQHLHLKNIALGATTKNIELDEALRKAQTKLVVERSKFVHGQTVKLRDLVGKLGKKKKITPETLQKIQDVYGILANNVAQADPEAGMKEYQILASGGLPVDPEILTEEHYTAPVDSVAAAKENHRESVERQDVTEQDDALKAVHRQSST